MKKLVKCCKEECEQKYSEATGNLNIYKDICDIQLINSLFIKSSVVILTANTFEKNVLHLNAIHQKKQKIVHCIVDSYDNPQRPFNTFIYTKNKSVSIKEIFNAFDRVFPLRYICKILGQLMTRVEGEIWRRPIYYSKNALDNEKDIENKLYSQYEKYIHNESYNYVEFKICECGQTYITAIVPHFEFYSIRINEEYQNLYCVEDSEQLKVILQNVFEKIEVCCNKQIEFSKEYIAKYRIDKVTYLSLKFHPRTLKNMNPQLHIERVIFSHIEYFNRYRKYLISKRQPDIYDEFNEILLEYIGSYLKLYSEYVSRISSDRNGVVKELKKKLETAKSGNKYISIET